MKTLVIFDFDDTLFKSESQIVVKSPRSGTKYLSTNEYATYVPEHDDEMDFSQFDEYPANPEPIRATITKLRQAILKFGIENVIILSARGKEKPIIDVLNNFQLPQVSIAALGDSNPALKANYVARTIDEEGYDKVVVYEDSIKNITAIKTAVVSILGPDAFTAYNVKQKMDGHTLTKH